MRIFYQREERRGERAVGRRRRGFSFLTLSLSSVVHWLSWYQEGFRRWIFSESWETFCIQVRKRKCQKKKNPWPVPRKKSAPLPWRKFAFQINPRHLSLPFPQKNETKRFFSYSRGCNFLQHNYSFRYIRASQGPTSILHISCRPSHAIFSSNCIGSGRKSGVNYRDWQAAKKKKREKERGYEIQISTLGKKKETFSIFFRVRKK